MTNTTQSDHTFVLTIEDQDIAVRYKPNYISGHDPHAILGPASVKLASIPLDRVSSAF